MISSVLDTNVLASGFVGAVSPPALLVNAWRDGRFRLIVSDHILGEVAHALEKPYFVRRLGHTEIQHDLHLLRTGTRRVVLTVSVVGVATHPRDDLVLATALSGGAEYLVTGDRQLLRLGSYEGVAIVALRAFLGILGLHAGEG